MVQRQLGDLVEKQRATVRRLEKTVWLVCAAPVNAPLR